MNFLNPVIKFFREDVSVEPVVFLYMTSIFLEMSITQDLIFTKLCLEHLNVTSAIQCRNMSAAQEIPQYIKDETTRWISYYSACMFVFTLLAASYIGSWSDRFSRKYTMFIPPIGSILATIVACLNGAYLQWNVSLLLISAFLSGISGGTAAMMASSFGYVSDTTSQEKRSKRIVIIEAMIFLAATVGMSAGGALNKSLQVHERALSSYAIIYLLEIALLLIVIAYIVFCISDVPTAIRDSPDTQHGLLYRLFNLNHVFDSIRTVFKAREGNNRLHVLLLVSCAFLVFFSMGVQTTLLYIFATDSPLKWTHDMYSYYNATSFGVSGLALVLGLPLAFHYLNVRDTTFGMLGICSKIAGLVLLGLSNSTPLAYMCTVLFIFSEYPLPAIRSILSKIVEPNERAKIFAFVQILQTIVLLLSSQIFNNLYIVTPFFHGLSFEIVAGIETIALALLFYLHHKMTIPNIPYRAMDDVLIEEN